MAGLIGSLAAGAAKGYGEATQQNTQIAAQADLRALEMEVRQLMDDRIYERTKGDKEREYTRERADKLTDIESERKFKSEEAAKQHKRSLGLISAGKEPLDKEAKQLALDEAKKEAGYKQGLISSEANLATAKPGTEEYAKAEKDVEIYRKAVNVGDKNRSDPLSSRVAAAKAILNDRDATDEQKEAARIFLSGALESPRSKQVDPNNPLGLNLPPLNKQPNPPITRG